MLTYDDLSDDEKAQVDDILARRQVWVGMPRDNIILAEYRRDAFWKWMGFKQKSPPRVREVVNGVLAVKRLADE